MAITDDAELPILPKEIEFHPGVITLRNENARLREALKKIIAHGDRNGMQNWRVMKKAREALAASPASAEE